MRTPYRWEGMVLKIEGGFIDAPSCRSWHAPPLSHLAGTATGRIGLPAGRTGLGY